MFWALLYMWLSGGTPPPEQSIIPGEKLLREVMSDSPRLEDVLEISGEGNQLELQLSAATADRDAELVYLARRHEADPEQFQATFSELDRNRLATQESLLDCRFRLRALLTREEWDALYGNPP